MKKRFLPFNQKNPPMLRRKKKSQPHSIGYGYDFLIKGYTLHPVNGGDSGIRYSVINLLIIHFALQLHGPFSYDIHAWFSPSQALWAVVSERTLPLQSFSCLVVG